VVEQYLAYCIAPSSMSSGYCDVLYSLGSTAMPHDLNLLCFSGMGNWFWAPYTTKPLGSWCSMQCWRHVSMFLNNFSVTASLASDRVSVLDWYLDNWFNFVTWTCGGSDSGLKKIQFGSPGCTGQQHFSSPPPNFSGKTGLLASIKWFTV
jgi:hypothetical protein